ncbi:hypothetical protein SAMN05421538_10579 [Paracoccus isoporae]|uniref:Uncharacterized protein n=1 Tax=Paracoccus isoporae TaxID=591205 RepID=A0A1G7BFF2_9RHOB|nr:hypothetical protein [Paracoccus isoporae]SDE25779.1 hypothetical protein SAMN05421538_10579 [Paracoccus isoporae]
MNQISGVGADLLGVFAVAIGAAALLYALSHALRAARRPLPTWVLPAGIGASMLIYATWNEYSWASRIKAQLPERVQVVAEGTGRSGLRPWTFVVAPTSRLALIDPQAVRDDGQGAQIVPVILVERWKRSVTVEQGVDCAAGRTRAPDADWQPAAPGDPAFAAICGQGG